MNVEYIDVVSAELLERGGDGVVKGFHIVADIVGLLYDFLVGAAALIVRSILDVC